MVLSLKNIFLWLFPSVSLYTWLLLFGLYSPVSAQACPLLMSAQSRWPEERVTQCPSCYQ